MRLWLVGIVLTAAGTGMLAIGNSADPGEAKPGEAKPGAHPTNLEKLNSEADETDPFNADGSNLYYASNQSGLWEILQSRRAATSVPWPKGKGVFGNPECDFRSPFRHKETIYYACNQISDPKFKDLRNFDIWRKTGELAAFRLIAGGINEVEDEMHPWITPAGKEFYFSRKTKAGWKLLMAKGPSLGPIGDAREVGFDVGFHHATLTSTTLSMYLEGPLKNGRVGIFRSRRANVGATWSKPEPLVTLNHPQAMRGDMSPSLGADGTRLFFASDRPGGRGGLDIWTVLVNELREK